MLLSTWVVVGLGLRSSRICRSGRGMHSCSIEELSALAKMSGMMQWSKILTVHLESLKSGDIWTSIYFVGMRGGEDVYRTEDD